MVTILSSLKWWGKDWKGTIERRKSHSLRWFILLSYISISLLPLLFFYTTFSNSLETHFIEERQVELKRHAIVNAVHVGLSNYLSDESKKVIFDYDIATSSKEGGFRIIVTDVKGMVVNATNASEIGVTYLIPEIMSALEGKDIARIQPDKSVYAAASIVDKDSNRVGAVLIVSQANDIFERMNKIQSQLFIILMLTALIVSILSFFISQIIMDPINSVLKVIQKMSDGHLTERIKTKGRNEIAELGQAFNDMADKLETVDGTRQEFVSNVSHELKTPLSSIKVLSESILFQESAPEEIYKEFLRDINNEVDRMTEIINDLLALVKFDQKEVPLIFKPTNINLLVETIMKRIAPLAEQKEIQLIFESIKEVTADTDETKLTLAISNLIDNAIKYTNSGGSVKVTINSDHQHMFITVKDTGIGIPEAEQGKVFERFYRVDKTRDRETGGTGLGLAITQKTVLLHNGSIRVSSRENEGTTFAIRIPLHQII